MSDLSENDLKKIIVRRDKRFDGRFYFGVKTTHIYCRPVCPARPKAENIVIFKSASEAEKNGFRPCLRCRPDVAPGSRFFDGTLNTVSRALRIINDGANNDLDIKALTNALGVSDRHLRRLFDQHLGASPIEVLITQRLHFAKQLVQMTSLPILDVAFASGFQSLRRFNEAFKDRFRMSPLQLRDRRKSVVGGSALSLKIPVHLPYDWQQVISFLERHECFGTEAIRSNRYHRFIPTIDGFGTITVAHEIPKGFLSVEFSGIPLNEIRTNLLRIKRLFDTDHNPAYLPSTKKYKDSGIRVPASFDPFEVAISIILGQLVSTKHAKATLRSVVKRYGIYLGEGESAIYAFPSPQSLAKARLEELGITRAKATAIRTLSAAIVKGAISFNSFKDFSAASNEFCQIKGIGPWTAAMMTMRCLADPDAFPESDLIVQRAIKENRINLGHWKSSRAYLTQMLWKMYADAPATKKKRKIVK